MSDAQDVSACHVCAGPLLTTPRLGEWIMHPTCRDAVQRYCAEATTMERSRARRIVTAAWTAEYQSPDSDALQCLTELLTAIGENDVV